jgi:hypothetical protein
MKVFIASRWRNGEIVKALSSELRERNHEVYSFLDNGANLTTGNSVVDEMKEFGEALSGWEHNPNIKKIFDSEMDSIKRSDVIVVLQPAGHSSLLEAGIGYGMGKEVIMVGPVEQPEVFYLICRRIYDTVDSFLADFGKD